MDLGRRGGSVRFLSREELGLKPALEAMTVVMIRCPGKGTLHMLRGTVRILSRKRAMEGEGDSRSLHLQGRKAACLKPSNQKRQPRKAASAAGLQGASSPHLGSDTDRPHLDRWQRGQRSAGQATEASCQPRREACCTCSEPLLLFCSGTAQQPIARERSPAPVARDASLSAGGCRHGAGPGPKKGGSPGGGGGPGSSSWRSSSSAAGAWRRAPHTSAAMAQAWGAEDRRLERGEAAARGPGGGGGTCPEHALPLDWFCCGGRRLVCAQCPACPGGCPGHRLRPLAEEAAERRNRIVDQCERLQLQRAAIARFVGEVLPEKKQRLVSTASSAREVLIQRLNLVRSVCESEEQRLLEVAHTEEERAHQNLLTQQVHWTESLQKLDSLRTYLVATITATDDLSLVQAEEEIFERTEEADGILKPQESERLNFNSRCVQSPLLSRLWAAAVLCWASDEIHVDEKTVSPLLALSEDKRTLIFSPKKARTTPDGPARFDHWPNALATESFHTGIHAWKVSVAKSCAYKLGVSYSSLQRKGSGLAARLGCNPFSWVFSRYDKEFQFSHNDHHQTVQLLKCPAEIGVLVDLDAGELLFYDPESCAVLYTHREAFTGPVYPALAVADQSISLMW